MAAIITEEKPREESGFFGFFDGVSREIGSWFGDAEATPGSYPSLATIPESKGYDKKMEELKDTKQELEADRDSAQTQQKSQISDWSELAQDPEATTNSKPAPVVATPAAAPTVAKPAESIAMPAALEPAKKVERVQPKTPPAPLTVLKAAPVPEPAYPVVIPSPEPQVTSPAIPQPAIQEETIIETNPQYLRAPAPAAVDLLPANRYAKRR